MSRSVTSGRLHQMGAAIDVGASISLDNVQVHGGQVTPMRLGAHAYAQGDSIHFASGQERHLPHELGHVVQQRQGRVTPTASVAGVPINDDVSLEKEADRMGEKAMRETSAKIKPRPPRDFAEIQSRSIVADTYPCHASHLQSHHRVRAEVLPHLVQQQQTVGKQDEGKSGSAGQSLAETLRQLHRSETKDELGKEQAAMAQVLAEHLLRSDCKLAEAIVAQLFDERSMFWIKNECNLEAAVELIGEQLRSE